MFESMVRMNENNLPVICSWLNEYRHCMNMIVVPNIGFGGDLMHVYRYMAMCSPDAFFELLNMVKSLTFSNSVSPVMKVSNKNIFVVDLRKIRKGALKEMMRKVEPDKNMDNMMRVCGTQKNNSQLPSKIWRLGKLKTVVQMNKVVQGKSSPLE